MCKFRPSVPIIAITDSIETCQKLAHYCGVFATLTDEVTDINSHDAVAIQVAKSFGFKPGDTLITTSGWGQRHGKTNTLRIVDVE